MLLYRRTRIVPAAFVVLALAITTHLVHFLAALGCDALRRRHQLQALDRGAHQVDRIARTNGLGQHVFHTDHFEHGAHRTAGDHAGTLGSGLHVHARGAVIGLDRMPQRAVVELDVGHAAACAFHCLGNRDRNLTRLAITKTDATVAIADHGQRGEAHLPATLDRLGHAVDGNELLQHAVAVFTFVVCHLLSPY